MVIDSNTDDARMIVLDGVDGAGKGVQSRLLLSAFSQAGHDVILTREPGGSVGAEQIRDLLVTGDPDRWDSMTELLLMYAARRSHLKETIWPALKRGTWVICDRYADSSRAFQGLAGNLGLETVETIHDVVVEQFEPAMVLILDVAETVSLDRARHRGGAEDRFERKGSEYQARVRQAFIDIAAQGGDQYRVIEADQGIAEVHAEIIAQVNKRFSLSLEATKDCTDG